MITTFSTNLIYSDCGLSRSDYCRIKSSSLSVHPVNTSYLFFALELTLSTLAGRLPEKTTSEGDPFVHRATSSRVKASLYVLACSFNALRDDGDMQSILTFLKAYVQKGTISRKEALPQNAAVTIFDKNFHGFHSASNRVATEARDYVFATVPQFSWYQYLEQAKHMTFSTIFLDLYQQAVLANHQFTTRILQSMTEEMPSGARPRDAWAPSENQPQPGCLGDFLKLLGNPSDDNSAPQLCHFTNTVHVHVARKLGLPDALHVIEKAMLFSQEPWSESHVGGELSQYGCWPVTSSIGVQLEVARDNSGHDEPPASHHGAWIRTLEASLVEEDRARETDEIAVPQAFKTLDEMWCAVSPKIRGSVYTGDWKAYRLEFVKRDRRPVKDVMLTLAAMASCRVPLSTLDWVRQLFVPVLTVYPDEIVLGLLATHCANDFISNDSALLSEGRCAKAMGKELVLVHPISGCAVGLLPDFLPKVRTHEEYIQRIRALYADEFIDYADGDGCIVRTVPIENICAQLRSAGLSRS